MDMLCLAKPDKQYLQQIASYRQDFLDAGSSMDGCGPLRRFDDPMEWLLQIEAMSHLETRTARCCPPNFYVSGQRTAGWWG